MAFVSYYPTGVFDHLRHEMTKRCCGGSENSRTTTKPQIVSSTWSPAVDIKEDEKQFVLRADLPGVEPAEVEIQVEKGVLSINGERKVDAGEQAAHAHVERVFGTFRRRFTLPESADAGNISATSRNGVVEITIGKKPAVLPRKIAVNS